MKKQNSNYPTVSMDDIKFKSPIPKIIHQFAKNRDNSQNSQLLKSIYPDWIVLSWDERKIINFVYNYYPEYFSNYTSLKDSYMGIYLVMKHFGGLFVQAKLINRNIDTLLAEYDLVFLEKNNKHEVADNIFASIPSHPFWDFLIARMPAFCGGNVINEFLGQFLETIQGQKIRILDHKYLFPLDASQDSFAHYSSNKEEFNISELDKSYITPLYDKLFIINLKRSADRWAKIATYLFENGIIFYRFEAVDGYDVKITLADNQTSFRGIDVKRKIYNLKQGEVYKIECNNGVQPVFNINLKSIEGAPMAGTIGTCCSMVLLREEIIRKNYSHTVIFEDDFVPITQNLTININEFITALPEYDIAYLHNYIQDRDRSLKINDLVSSFNKAKTWWGDWAYMLSYEGARKLNIDRNFNNPSDQYARDLALRKIVKPGVESFKAFFSNQNFSLLSKKFYEGMNPESVSSKMGCRSAHPNSFKNCGNSTAINKIFVINFEQEIAKMELMSSNLYAAGIKVYTRFKGCNSFDVKITNLENEQIFFAKDIKTAQYQMLADVSYKITCNPENDNPTEFNFKGSNNYANDIQLGAWCSNVMLWQYIKNQNYDHVVILSDDISFKENFAQDLEEFFQNLPRTYDIAFIGFAPDFPKINSTSRINNYVNKIIQAPIFAANTIIYSAKGIEKLLSFEEYSYLIDGTIANNFEVYVASKEMIHSQICEHEASVDNGEHCLHYLASNFLQYINETI